MINFMKNTDDTIAIVIPAYNESRTITKVITNLRRELKQNSIRNEIIVIDDCSSDDTADKAEKAKAYVIKHLINTGSGGATATGLQYAKLKSFKIAATIDADDQHAPDDLVKGIKLMLKSKNDLIIGSRLVNTKGMPFLKIIGNKGMTFLTYILYGVTVTDTQSGMRIYSSKAINNLTWKSYDYGYCSEMIWRAKIINLKISEFPIRAIYTDYSKNKGQNNWNVIRILGSLIRWRVLEIFGE